MALSLWESGVAQNANLHKGDLFVDLGAHIGYYTAKAAKQVGNQGQVIAVEPDKRSLKVLHQNVRQFPNVTVLEAAAGSDGYVYLNTARDPTMTTVAKTGAQNAKVPSISLDAILSKLNRKPRGAVIKIDVEGSELEVIKGGLNFIKELKPTFIIESWAPQELMGLLGKMGYRCRELFKENYLFYPSEP